FGENGSGMHTHQSLFAGGRNAFFDADDEWSLSDAGKGFIAGQLHHARELSAVFAQWVNSYKRLVPGYEAPVYVAWSRRNRSALIRIPLYKPGHEQATRAEIRCPDPACNPYLTFAALLHAGLEGIEHGYELPEPMETNLYHLTPEQRRGGASAPRRRSARPHGQKPARPPGGIASDALARGRSSARLGVGVSALVSTAAPAKAGTASRRHRKRCLGSWSFIGPVGRRRLSVGQHGRTGTSRHGLQAASQAMPWLVVVVRAA